MGAGILFVTFLGGGAVLLWSAIADVLAEGL